MSQVSFVVTVYRIVVQVTAERPAMLLVPLAGRKCPPTREGELMGFLRDPDLFVSQHASLFVLTRQNVTNRQILSEGNV